MNTFIILCNNDAGCLEEDIGRAMKDGWIPLGGTVVPQNYYGPEAFCARGVPLPLFAHALFRENGAGHQELENTAMRFLRGVERRTRIWQILFWVVAVCFFWMVLIERL